MLVMKFSAVVLIMFLPAMICFSLAGYMAIHGKEGWGWFLFIGLLCMGVSYTSKDDDKVK